ncbi:hypothetical protein ABHV46_06745 [Asaia sp. BMEF1]|uniref:hypothetical protein n=1 Tax=Asaia sp. BMEF1 TaxID=3155932 RepID=UPI003F673C9A
MAETLHQIARFLVPTWPLLAACLLALMPEAQAGRSARLFALTGLILTALLDPFLSGQDVLARWACFLAGCVPFLSWQAREKRLALCLNFLASSTIMLALSVHTLLPVTCLTACGALILALRETLVTTRARQAWESMRLRLAGVVLALLGTSLTTMTPDAATLRLGDLFLSIGLCLMAGLGTPVTTHAHPATEEPGTALLDMLLCLSVVALMIRLPERDITHMVLILAGLAGLWLCVGTRQDNYRPLVALAVIASALPHGVVPALLLMSSALALAAAPSINRSARFWILGSLPPWPGFAAGLGIVAGLATTGVIPVLLCLLALGLMASRARLGFILPSSWQDRIVLGALLTLGLASPFLMTLPEPVWALHWRAP